MKNVLINCTEYDPINKKLGSGIGIVFGNIQAIREVTENDGTRYCAVEMAHRTYFIFGSYDGLLKNLS